MYNSHNNIFECIKPPEREGQWGAEQWRGGTGGDNGSCQQQRQEPTGEAIIPSCLMYLGRHFLSSASVRCAVAHVRLRWRRRRRLVAVGENFLFSSLAWQLGRRKGVFFAFDPGSLSIAGGWRKCGTLLIFLSKCSAGVPLAAPGITSPSKRICRSTLSQNWPRNWSIWQADVRHMTCCQTLLMARPPSLFISCRLARSRLMCKDSFILLAPHRCS